MFVPFFYNKLWLLTKMVFSYTSYLNNTLSIFFTYRWFIKIFLIILIFLFVNLGDFDVFFNYFSIFILGIIVFNVINLFSFKSLLRRFGFLKISRRDFYECGFRPQTQKPIKLPIQFLLICVFFLIYDIELVFLFPYVSGITFSGFYDLLLLFLFFILFLISLIIDYERHALYWQY